MLKHAQARLPIARVSALEGEVSLSACAKETEGVHKTSL